MAEPAPPSRDAALARAVDFIRSGFHRRLTLAQIAAAAGMSRFHFHRLFTRRFGQTPLRMVAALQVEHAKELMRQGVPLPDVAARCGFAHHAHFSFRFKQLTGVTPARWLWAQEPGPPLGRPAASRTPRHLSSAPVLDRPRLDADAIGLPAAPPVHIAGGGPSLPPVSCASVSANG
jgi:AraC-like DNA-binding protein